MVKCHDLALEVPRFWSQPHVILHIAYIIAWRDRWVESLHIVQFKPWYTTVIPTVPPAPLYTRQPAYTNNTKLTLVRCTAARCKTNWRSKVSWKRGSIQQWAAVCWPVAALMTDCELWQPYYTGIASTDGMLHTSLIVPLMWVTLVTVWDQNAPQLSGPVWDCSKPQNTCSVLGTGRRLQQPCLSGKQDNGDRKNCCV